MLPEDRDEDEDGGDEDDGEGDLRDWPRGEALYINLLFRAVRRLAALSVPTWEGQE